MRVVLDANVVVSAFLSPTGAPARVFACWEQQAFELVVSEPLLREYQRALQYGRVAARHEMTVSETAALIEEFRQFSLVVEPEAIITAVAEDPDDNKILECAVTGAADYIVSGDRHLLRPQEFQGIPILPPSAFLMLVEQEGKPD